MIREEEIRCWLDKLEIAAGAMGHYGTWAPDDDDPTSESEASNAMIEARSRIAQLVLGKDWV